MKTNKKYKSSVFSLLFSESNLLRELYCALDGVSLPPDAPVSINTLKDVLFKDLINDISFEIDGKLVVLVEHQSTINENMALRFLMYIGRIYEKITKGKNIYARKPIKIPVPEFFVLYNGVEPCQDQYIYRLSDSFKKLDSLGLMGKSTFSLELVVSVININEGRNQALAARCKKLAEYSAFIAKVRSFMKELGNLKEAIKKAINYCQKHDILREFLELHATEVLNMLYTEWNMDDALAVAREEGLEEGHFNEKLEIARNLLAKGSTFEFVQEITGLDMETIENL
jgi:predicted transposase/invertase (TIGR01784 family)